MIDISLQNISKSFGGFDILQNLSCQIKAGETVGLVGRNGSGKTTLFKIMAGQLSPDKGEISVRKGLVIAFLDQLPAYDDNISVEQVIRAGLESLNSIRDELSDLEQRMTSTSGIKLEKLTREYGILQTRFEQGGGYGIDVEVDKIAAGLKIQNLRSLKFEKLSGGEKTRVMLAQLLLKKPDLLLLDEPTNHLDLSSIEWLEEYLSDIKGSIFVISHDRYFLNRTVDRIFELEKGQIDVFTGDYEFYVKAKKQQYETLMAEYKQSRKKIKALKEAAERFRIWGRINPDNSAHFARAKRCEEEIEELSAIRKPGRERKMTGNFRMGKRSGRKVVHLKNIRKSFDKDEILKGIDLDLRFGEKTALLGKNGSGKTTLFRIIRKEYEPEQGESHLGPSVKTGYLEQEIRIRESDLTLLELVMKETGLTQAQTRNLLAGYLFTADDVFKKPGQLSGGEKVRLRICLMMQKDINFLLLDEPTNHLDIISREVLEKAIEEFRGTVLFISHDRYLINRIARKTLEIENGMITEYLGNYDYYREKKTAAATVGDESAGRSPKPVYKNKDQMQQRRKVSRIRELENRISWSEKELEEVETGLLVKTSDIDHLNELYQRKCNLREKIGRMYEEWEFLAGEEEGAQ